MDILYNYTGNQYGFASRYKAQYQILERTKTSASVKIDVDWSIFGNVYLDGYVKVEARLYFNGSSTYSTITLKPYSTTISNPNPNDYYDLSTKTGTFTVNDLQPNQTKLPINITIYKIESGYEQFITRMYGKEVEIANMHSNPIINSYTIEEANTKLTSLGISNIDDYFIIGLSKKKYTFNITYDDNATFNYAETRYNYISGDVVAINSTKNGTTNPCIIDTASIFVLSGSQLQQDFNMGVFIKVYDSYNASSDRIWTTKPSIYYYKPTITGTAKRTGQTTNRVKISCSGTYDTKTFGTENHSIASGYRPTIKVKYWKVGDENNVYTDTVSSSNVSVSQTGTNQGTFTVSDYIISGTNFNYLYSYRVVITIDDYYNEVDSTTISIGVGEATWSEYKDRVRFKKIEVDGNTQTNQINGQTWDTATNNTTDTWVPVFASGNKLQHRVIPNTYNSTSPSLVSPTLSGTLKMVAGQSIEFYNGSTKYAGIYSSSQYKDLFLDSGGGYVYIRNNGSTIASFRNDGKIYNGSSVAYALTTDIATHFTIETKEAYTTAVASGSQKDLSYNVSKSNYTPIALIGVRTTGTRSSFVNIYEWYLTGTTVHVVFRNTHTSNALVNNDTKITITILYVSNS